MSGTTITGGLYLGVNLTAASQLPLVITRTGSVFASGNYASAVYAPLGLPGTVENYGILRAGSIYGGGYGINLHAGGTILNGSFGNPGLIEGGFAGVLSGARGALALTNFGTISSTDFANGIGVNAGGDATVVNGDAAENTARIRGYFDGVFIGGVGTVNNCGTIAAAGASSQYGRTSFGVYLRLGGTIWNGVPWGTPASTGASITGVAFGVEVAHAAGRVENYGTIAGTGTIGRGVVLNQGGTVVNGGTANRTATIWGAAENGVYAGGPDASTVTNFGTITGGKNGVSLQTGGTVVNGAPGNAAALISGERQGVYILGRAASSVLNYGTLSSTGGYWGVSIYLNGTIVNGASGATLATIMGGGGVYDGAVATVANYGTIEGDTRPGVNLLAGGTLTNFGSIGSRNGIAVYLAGGDSRVRVAPGAVFDGAVRAMGGGNTLELLPGSGTLDSVGRAVSGFANVTVDAGAHWALTGQTSLAALGVAGSLDVPGALALDGTASLAPGATLEVSDVQASGAVRFQSGSTLVLDRLAGFGTPFAASGAAGPLLTGFAAGDTIDMRDLKPLGVVVLDPYPDLGALVIHNGQHQAFGALFFTPSLLSSGHFVLTPDGAGGLNLTHT